MTHSEIPVDVVLKACDAYLENRERHIAKVKEECIQREMLPWKIFGITFRGKTREEAIKELEGRHGEFTMIEIEGGFWARKVREVRALCQVPGAQTVKLSSEDAHTLRRFFG